MKKISSHVLRRLGSLPFWRGETKFLPAMDQAYDKAAAFAARTLAKHKEDENATED
ncbi:MAG: hypothetical protein J6W80_00770 [Kiritimatiellae bacterium]|nr:hypothetical protein [Kiritimatiellia bacterium]